MHMQQHTQLKMPQFGCSVLRRRADLSVRRMELRLERCDLLALPRLARSELRFYALHFTLYGARFRFLHLGHRVWGLTGYGLA